MLSFVRTKPYTKARTRFVYIHWNIWSNMWYAIRNLTNWKIKCRKGSLSSQKRNKGSAQKVTIVHFPCVKYKHIGLHRVLAPFWWVEEEDEEEEAEHEQDMCWAQVSLWARVRGTGRENENAERELGERRGANLERQIFENDIVVFEFWRIRRFGF